jgi:nitrogen fixation protein NifU and related proteins
MLDELYNELIKDHGNHPRNCRLMSDATCQAPGFNRSCGDSLVLYLKIDNGVIRDASFVGKGCQIFTASASLMTDRLKGKTTTEALAIFDSFHELLTTDVPIASEFGKLAALGGVRKFPMRVKCATLAWHTLANALNNRQEPTTTE